MAYDRSENPRMHANSIPSELRVKLVADRKRARVIASTSRIGCLRPAIPAVLAGLQHRAGKQAIEGKGVNYPHHQTKRNLSSTVPPAWHLGRRRLDDHHGARIGFRQRRNITIVNHFIGESVHHGPVGTATKVMITTDDVFDKMFAYAGSPFVTR